MAAVINSEEAIDCMRNVLPSEDFKVISFRALTTSNLHEEHFIADIRLPITDAEGAKKWIEDFQEKSKVTLRVKATAPPTANGKNLLKIYYRCHHNTRTPHNGRAGSKNSNCPAILTMTVKKPPKQLSKARNENNLTDYPTTVLIEHTHNHIINSASALKHRDVAPEVIEKFKNMFSKGHSPSSALDLHKQDLLFENGAEKYLFESADRSKCPDLQFCYRLYHQVFKKAYGSTDNMISDLEKACSEFNQVNGTECCKLEMISSGKIAIAICTPLMRRVHSQHRTSGEMVFVDSSSGMDRYDCHVFMLLTHSAAGGLPLGCLIVTSQAADVVTKALQLYVQLLPEDAFFGRGPSVGPQVLLTDDSNSERKSLAAVWPSCIQLLCTFHVLQAAWRFLWDRKNNIVKEWRPHLLNIIKRMMYAHSQSDIDAAYQEALVAGAEHPHFSKYIEKLHNRQALWAVCHRKELLIRGNHTNNYCEAAMRVLKDKVFERTRAYNIVQLADFILTRLETYYERRLLDIANGKSDYTFSRKYLADCKGIMKEMIQPIGNNLFSVDSQSELGKVYHVDLNYDMCSCTAGMTGAPCKHQHAVTRYFRVSALNTFPTIDASSRLHFYKLARGHSNINPGWFKPLVDDRKLLPDVSLNNIYETETPQDLPAPFDTVNETPHILNQSLPSSSENKAEEIEKAAIEFRKNLDRLHTEFSSHSEEFLKSVQSFNAQMDKLKTPSSLASALMGFGKNMGACSALRRGIITVQPTAVARRTTPVGGRRCLQTGRKPLQHSLTTRKRKEQVDSCQLLPKKKHPKAVHNLSVCVQKNENLGKNHSSKFV